MRPRRNLAAATALLTLVSLAGCSFVANGFEPTLQGASAWQGIKKELSAQEDPPVATIRLSKVPGRWSKVVMICRGVTTRQITRALGFAWDGPTPNNAAYGYLIFASDKKVEQYYVGHSDQDENFVDHWIFSTCPVVAGFEMPAPIILARGNSPTLDFQRQESTAPHPEVWWEIAPAEMVELQSQSTFER